MFLFISSNYIANTLKQAGKQSAFFYNWEQLRDLSRPDSLAYSYFLAGNRVGYSNACHQCTDAAISYIKENAPDFAFLYLGWVDEAGHAYGWMGDEYIGAVREAWQDIKRTLDVLDEEYTVIITADHGGHDRTHGTLMDEDMTIPFFIKGKDVVPGELKDDVSLKDIAPTIAHLLDATPAAEWEGKSLL